MKKIAAFILSITTAGLMFTGCNEKKENVKPVILSVSFGTSYNESREKTIGGIETAFSESYPDYEIRRAFTSQTVIDILKERENIETDNVEQALEKLISDGVSEVKIQPTHIMSGYEYDDLVLISEKYSDKFDSLTVGKPLLSSEEDYNLVAKALINNTSSYNNEDTAVVFMGHGTEHSSNESYLKLQNKFKELKADNYFVGTVEASPSLEDIIEEVKSGKYEKVVLQPLMVVAGDHANNDMAGDESDSWKKSFEAEGFKVETVLKGMGEIEEIQQIYVNHIG